VRLSGYTQEEVLGHAFAEFVDPNDLPELAKAFMRVLAGHRDPIEFRVFTRDGAARWVRSSSRRQLAGGVPVGITGSLTDVTERKQAELALLESEERYRELVENANDLVYVHDLEGNFLAINRAAERTAGYLREEIGTLNIIDIVAPEDVPRTLELLHAVLGGDEAPTAFEADVITKDGRRLTLEISPRVVLRDGVRVAVQAWRET